MGGTCCNSEATLCMLPASRQTLDGKTQVLDVPEYKTVLEAALDEGIELPHDCKLGTCLVSDHLLRGSYRPS
jgi:ferredoxin